VSKGRRGETYEIRKAQNHKRCDAPAASCIHIILSDPMTARHDMRLGGDSALKQAGLVRDSGHNGNANSHPGRA